MPTYCMRCGKKNKYAYQFYCSDKCREDGKNHCKICGKIIEPNRTYCSRKCAGMAGLKVLGSKPRNTRKIDENGNYWCNGCHKFLPENAFDKLCTGKLNEGTHKTNLQSRCKECSKKQRYEWHENTKSHLFDLVNRARRRSREFLLSPDWAVKQYKLQKGMCYYTGIPMTTYQGKGKLWSNASIDRINNDIGYTPDNCILCCNGFNLMKNTLPIEALVFMCQEFLKRYNNNELNKIDFKKLDISKILSHDIF